MADLKISGETNPEIGKEIIYSISPVDFGNTISHPTSPISITPVHWEIYVLEKSRWRKTGQNAKTGDTVTYNFNQKSLVREGIKIVVTRGNDYGELRVKTKRAGKPKVTKIDLLDRNYQKITKSLNYMDTIIARAYCNEMEGETVFFTLWEDDAAGSGHDKINEINKINTIPLRQTVKDGEAEVAFNLPLYTQAARIADMQVAKGDKNEGKNHEYYVTVDYYGKMVGESKNVNIHNPNYENPIQRAIELKYPEKVPQKAKQPNKRPTPAPEKPKKDAFKAPITAKAKTKAPDPQGKILSAEFVDGNQKPFAHMKFGTSVYAKVRTKGLKGKTVIIKIFEDDPGTDQRVYMESHTLPGDVSLIPIRLSQKMRADGDNLTEGKEQEYFLQIEYAGQSVTSSLVNVNDDAPRIKIETKPSTVGVKKQEQKKQEDNKVCECEAKVRAFLRLIMVKESEQLAIKQGYSPYEINVGGKSFIQDYKKDYSTHPRVYISSANSTAAGAYQFLGWKYDEMHGYEIDKDTYKKTGKYIEEKDYIKKYKLKDFSPLSQDKLCLANLKHYKSGVINALLNDDINKALDIASYEWASLPHNDPNYKTKTEWRYPGQHGQTLEVARANYKKFLNEELQGKTKYLQLQKGFLKEFDYHCCEEKTIIKETPSNGKWRMPIDNPMLCMYSQGGGHKPWHGSFGENIRDGNTNHTGNDLLAVPGTKVYACLKGIIHKIYTSPTMAGNVIVLKVTDRETFKKLRNSSYVPKYKNKGELLERSFDHNGTIYLTFWHLSKNDFFKEGDEVKYNDVIGLTGISGWKGKNFTTRNPHLHFEISNIGSAPGLAHKCNPSVYFKFKTEDELTPTEIKFQNKLKEKEWK